MAEPVVQGADALALCGFLALMAAAIWSLRQHPWDAEQWAIVGFVALAAMPHLRLTATAKASGTQQVRATTAAHTDEHSGRAASPQRGVGSGPNVAEHNPDSVAHVKCGFELAEPVGWNRAVVVGHQHESAARLADPGVQSRGAAPGCTSQVA
ncbi:MAG: hypothetical protein WBL61_11980 [Bryobacteraceae bacterium]